MANGWDSYFHNPPPLASDPTTLKRTESERSPSEAIENFLGHHDFSKTVALHEAPATNSNFNTNCYSNSGSDCVFQRYYKEPQWKADVGQMEKDYLPNSDISDFATDGLSTSGSFPSSVATDIQGINQDCGMLATPFFENFSDVSSCSDADNIETKPSCKFVTSSSVPKPKIGKAGKHRSSEWLFPHTENMTIPDDSQFPHMSGANNNGKSPSNMKTVEQTVQNAHDEISSLDKIKNNASKDKPSPLDMSNTGGEPVEDGNDNDCCQKLIGEIEKKQEETAHIRMSAIENTTHGNKDYPDGKIEEQIPASSLSSMTASENENGTKQSLRQENVGMDNSHLTRGQDRDMAEKQLHESEVLREERKKPVTLETGIFEEQTCSNPNSKDGQDENQETNCEDKDMKSNTSQSLDLADMEVPDSQDFTHEVRECTSSLKSNTESCLQHSEHESYNSRAEENDCGSCTVMTDNQFSHVSEKVEKSIASHTEFCSQSSSASTEENSCQNEEWTSAAVRTNTNTPLDPDDNNAGVTCDSLSVEIGDKLRKGDSNSIDLGVQKNNSKTDIAPCLEEERTSATEKTITAACLHEHQSLDHMPVAPAPESLIGDVAETFQGLDTSTKEPPVLGMLYGEPLSREDSSCDTDETKLDISQYGDKALARLDGNSMNHFEGQVLQLKSSSQKKKLQPVVILKTSESPNGMVNSFHCANCQHTTYNVDHLIEHHHCCHSGQDFQFCQTCNLYLMTNEQVEKHSCGETKSTSVSDNPGLSSDSSLQKDRKKGIHKCNRCQLKFSKRLHYISHMRSHTGKTPYKCNECGTYFSQSCTLQRHRRRNCRYRMPQLPVKSSDAVIGTTISSPSKTLAQEEPSAKLRKCFVKLVDIYKHNLCRLCGKAFSTPQQVRKHFLSKHRKQKSEVLSSLCTTKLNVEKSQTPKNETSVDFKCPLCPRLFKYTYNRNRHLRQCVKDSVFGGKGKIDGKFRCPLCHATFTLSSNRCRHINSFCLRDYLSQLSKETMSRQKETEQARQSNAKETKTLSTETEQKPGYKCSLCPAFFFHPSGKYKHMKKHELSKLTGKVTKYRKSVFSTMSKPANSSSPKNEDNKNDLKSTETISSLALSCNFCGKSFGSLQSLKNHERIHRGERPYHCLECGKKFKKHAYLIGHKAVHQRRIQCTVCRKILPTIGELIQHRSTHIKRGMLKCPDCAMEFQYPAHLLKHLRTHKKQEGKTTQLEERLLIKPQLSQDSMKEKSLPKRLQCSLCRELFNDANLLRKHFLIHMSSSTQCPLCKRNFNHRRYLLRHMVIHTGDKPFSCTNCGKEFFHKFTLTVHHKTCLHAPTRLRVSMDPCSKTKVSLQCDYCPRVLKDNSRLIKHHSGHKTDSLAPCSRCGKYFESRKLTRHKNNCENTTKTSAVFSFPSKSITQTVQKRPSQTSANKMLPFKCSHCAQMFRYRSLLLRHLYSHTGVQPFLCSLCGKGFRGRKPCSLHEALCDGTRDKVRSETISVAATKSSSIPTLRETAQKPQAEAETELKCKFCTKTFMKPRNLRRHILTHNDVKPYRCRACDSCYSRYDHLKVHQTRCRGKKQRLEVRIPKVSLNDIGKGWQNKFGIDLAKKQETFDCTVCSRSFPTQSKLSRHNTMYHITKLFKCPNCCTAFSHAKTLKKHLKMRKCRKVSRAKQVLFSLGTNSSTENLTIPPLEVQTRVLKRFQPYFDKRNRHMCSYCPRAFACISQLDMHTRLHTGEKPYACLYCGERFIRKDYVKRHYPKCSKKHGQNKVLCDGCGGFFSHVKLENHKKHCSLKPNFSESTVGQSKQSTSHSQPKGFSCAYCSSRFLLFSQLQEHFLNAHKMETIVPPVSTAPLQHHLSNIPNIKEEPLDDSYDKGLSDGANVICKLDAALDLEVSNQYSCSECDMSFSCKNGLSAHQRVHKTELPFNCKICKRGFWNKNLHRNHYRKCRIAHISGSNSIRQLEVPVKAKMDFAPDDSVLVFKDFSKSPGTGVLQTHSSCQEDLIDDSQKKSEENQVEGNSGKDKKTVQYQCSECDQSFSDGLMLISHLEDHGRQEQEKKRNACTKCGKMCSSQGNLQKHMRIHLGTAKNYSCPDCSMAVNSQSELEIHRKCHDPNRRYSCKLCSQRFLTRPSLCNHYKDDHPEDAYTCRFCNKAYAAKKSLARHYKAWHQKELMDHQSNVQNKSCNEKQPSNQLSTPAGSDLDENNSCEDGDSDSAPYFPCHVCGKTFPTSESLEDHQRCHLGEKPHECAECGRCFFQASQLQQHQRMHKSEFQCQLCGRGFVSLFALRKHKHTHGKSRPYRCSKCHLSFTGPSQLAEHMTTHREESFPCDICNRVFPSKSSRAEHRKSHSKSRALQVPSVSRDEKEKSVSLAELKYRCGVCSERFRDPEELSEHGCIAAKERQYSCSECDRHFLHASHLKKHRATHKISWSSCEYPCNQCNSSFSSSKDFLSHAKSHVNTAAESDHNIEVKDGGPHGFICPVCHQCFASATELINHFPMHPDGTFECKICKMSFTSESKLKEHESSHRTSATGFECTKCGKSFLESNAFLQHQCSHQQQREKQTNDSNPSAMTSTMNYHQAAGEEEEVDVTGEDVHDCVVCSMQFSSKRSLLGHQNEQHTENKPFKCELCGKRFALRRYLKQHERRHSEKFTTQSSDQWAENKLKCTQCRIEFDSAEKLSLHMRLHAEKEGGEYRCDMCYKSFSQGSLLKQHQESHVGEVVYECTECDKAFAFPHLLEEHQQTHAGSSQ
ncbi:zinc finger protein 1035 [Labrus bergylta]|uniref:zinc finger protein 1035 n=1 Tax=Labrus bergylta TaxID=56723 RepID=UPI00331334A8